MTIKQLCDKVAALPAKAVDAMNEKIYHKLDTPENRAKLQGIYDKLQTPSVRESFLSAGGGRMAKLVRR